MSADNLLALQPALTGQKIDFSALPLELAAAKDDPAAFTQALVNQLQRLTSGAPVLPENSSLPSPEQPTDAKSLLAVLDQLRGVLGQPPLDRESSSGNISPVEGQPDGEGGKSVPIESPLESPRRVLTQDEPPSAEHMAELIAQLALMPAMQTPSASVVANDGKSLESQDLLVSGSAPAKVVPAPMLPVAVEVAAIPPEVAVSEMAPVKQTLANVDSDSPTTTARRAEHSRVIDTGTVRSKASPLLPLENSLKPQIVAEEDAEDDALAPLVKFAPRLQIRSAPARESSEPDIQLSDTTPAINRFAAPQTPPNTGERLTLQTVTATSANAKAEEERLEVRVDQPSPPVSNDLVPIAADLRRLAQAAPVATTLLAIGESEGAPEEWTEGRTNMPAASPVSILTSGSFHTSPSASGLAGLPQDLLKAVAARVDKVGGDELPEAIIDVKPELGLGGGMQNVAEVRPVMPMAQEMAALQSRPTEMAMPAKDMGPAVAVTLERPLSHPQWAEDFGERIHWVSRQGLQSAELRLNPAHLGPVEVRINMNQDQASVQFVAHHAAVREAIETALPKLREMLGNQQVQLADVSVSQQPFNDPQRDSRGAQLGYEQQQSGRSGPGYQGDSHEPAVLYPDGEQPLSRKETRSLLSLYA